MVDAVAIRVYFAFSFRRNALHNRLALNALYIYTKVYSAIIFCFLSIKHFSLRDLIKINDRLILIGLIKLALPLGLFSHTHLRDLPRYFKIIYFGQILILHSFLEPLF